MPGRFLKSVAGIWLILLFLDLTVIHFVFPHHAASEIFGCSVEAVVHLDTPTGATVQPTMIAHQAAEHGDHTPLPPEPDNGNDHSCFWNVTTVRHPDGQTPLLPSEDETSFPGHAGSQTLDRPFRNLFRPPRVS